MTVRCGHKTHDTSLYAIHHHEDVAMVRRCYGLEHGLYSLEEQAHLDGQSQAEYDADRAYERHLENGGSYAEMIAAERIAEENRRGLFEDYLDARAAYDQDLAEQAELQREHEGYYE